MNKKGWKTRPADTIGKRFGRLVVVEVHGRDSRNRTTMRCLCDCGKDHIVRLSCIVSGNAKSCGCYRDDRARESNLIHGESVGKPTSEFIAWCSLKDRCLNPQNKKYEYYGGRGIKVFPQWINDFPAFLKEVGRKPSPEHSLDRWPDQNGNYEPGNVRWANDTEQASNRRSNHRITFNGETRILKDWAAHLGINRNTLRRRINLYSVEGAFTRTFRKSPDPLSKRKSQAKAVPRGTNEGGS